VRRSHPVRPMRTARKRSGSAALRLASGRHVPAPCGD